ncbi:glutathione S-transferase-like [Oppia nitens]|uniref:glutathione S-transferase-like n=1 Tax=Oppia nitens TaxID=1686743 RepID=UPI0023DC984C|nr:glutathione S-transferase-like [Oppia nitens]
MAPTLGYWNIRGKGEPIRLLLTYTGTKFEDKRYSPSSSDDWFKRDKQSLGFDFPNLPYYIDDDNDVKLTQQLAICRYIAGKHQGLSGQSGEEQRRVNVVEQQLTEMSSQFSQLMLHPDYDTIKADYLEKRLSPSLQLLGKFLGDRPFLAGQTVTYVDFIAFELLEKLNAWQPLEVYSKVDKLKQFTSRVRSLPSIANYLLTAPNVPFNGPHFKWGGSV